MFQTVDDDNAALVHEFSLGRIGEEVYAVDMTPPTISAADQNAFERNASLNRIRFNADPVSRQLKAQLDALQKKLDTLRPSATDKRGVKYQAERNKLIVQVQALISRLSNRMQQSHRQQSHRQQLHGCGDGVPSAYPLGMNGCGSGLPGEYCEGATGSSGALFGLDALRRIPPPPQRRVAPAPLPSPLGSRSPLIPKPVSLALGIGAGVMLGSMLGGRVISKGMSGKIGGGIAGAILGGWIATKVI